MHQVTGRFGSQLRLTSPPDAGTGAWHKSAVTTIQQNLLRVNSKLVPRWVKPSRTRDLTPPHGIQSTPLQLCHVVDEPTTLARCRTFR
jgi:hypothetical protein